MRMQIRPARLPLRVRVHSLGDVTPGLLYDPTAQRFYQPPSDVSGENLPAQWQGTVMDTTYNRVLTNQLAANPLCTDPLCPDEVCAPWDTACIGRNNARDQARFAANDAAAVASGGLPLMALGPKVEWRAPAVDVITQLRNLGINNPATNPNFYNEPPPATNPYQANLDRINAQASQPVQTTAIAPYVAQPVEPITYTNPPASRQIVTIAAETPTTRTTASDTTEGSLLDMLIQAFSDSQQTATQQPGPYNPAVSDTTGTGANSNTLSTETPLDFEHLGQSIYDSLPATLQQTWDKATQLAPGWVWFAGAAIALYMLTRSGRKR